MDENFIKEDLPISTTDAPIERRPSVIRKIIFNVFGFFAGYYAGALALRLAKWLLFDVVGNLGFITKILSWPVDYGTYALTGVLFVDAAVSLKVCGFVSRFGKAKRNYSCFVLGACRILTYIVTLIQTIVSDGFDLSVIWTMIALLIMFIVATIAEANNEEM